MDVRFIVGSMSRHKIGAITAACRALGLGGEVVGLSVPSGINEQPYGLDETRQGASARARKARTASPGADGWFGIESGIVSAGLAYFDITFVVLRLDDQVFEAIAAGPQLDPSDVQAAIERGFATTTVGSVMAKRTGSDATDPTAHITNGRVTRADLIQQAALIVLAQCAVARGWPIEAGERRG